MWRRHVSLTKDFPPTTPWTIDYVETHRRLVAALLDDRAAIGLFASSERLPNGWGIGFDERVVEYPWLLAQEPAGKTLDAGSVLNHAHILDRFQPRLSNLHIVTLAPEEIAFTERRISYLFADLRDLPYKDGWFDTVISVSTLEHVGMDNSLYGGLPARC